MFEEPDEVLDRVRGDIRRAQERVERLSELRSRLADVRGKARTPERDIVVEVDVGGILTGLRLSDTAFQRGGQKVAREIVALVQDALKDVQALMIHVTADVMGTDDPAVASLRALDDGDEAAAGAWREGVQRG